MPTAKSRVRYLVEMICPTLQRTTHLVGILRALVRSRNATAMAGVVVEDYLYVVGLHAEFAELSCASATEIVETPRSDPYAFI